MFYRHIFLKQGQRNSFGSIAMGFYHADMKSGGDSLFQQDWLRSYFYILFCGPVEIKSRFIRKCAKKKKGVSPLTDRNDVFYFDIELIELMKEVESALYHMVILTGARYVSKPPVET